MLEVRAQSRIFLEVKTRDGIHRYKGFGETSTNGVSRSTQFIEYFQGLQAYQAGGQFLFRTQIHLPENLDRK